MSPISSRKTVPRWAASKTPTRSRSAPVNAPRMAPKSSLSSSEGAMAAQSTGAQAEAMDHARHQFLAGAGLAFDHHGGIGGGDAHHLLVNIHHGGRTADHD